MFHHVKDLHFNARVSRPDQRFANLLKNAEPKGIARSTYETSKALK